MHEQMLAKLDLDHKDEKKAYRKLSDIGDRHGSAQKHRRAEKKGSSEHREKSTGKPKKKKPSEKK